jgi:hypothetical protein
LNGWSEHTLSGFVPNVKSIPGIDRRKTACERGRDPFPATLRQKRLRGESRG